jgi:hypothetical protein
LTDGELDFLHAATLEEMKRRGRKPQGVETNLQTLRNRFNACPVKKQPSQTSNDDMSMSLKPPFDAMEVERSACRL